MKLLGFLLINAAFCTAALLYGYRASQRRRWLHALRDFFQFAADEVRNRQKTRAAVGHAFAAEGHASPAIRKQLTSAACARDGFAALACQPALSVLQTTERAILTDADRAFSMPSAEGAAEELATVAECYGAAFAKANGEEKKRTDAVRSILALCGLLLSVLLL